MDCYYFKELLSVYIDNYIKQNEKLELEEHLLKCNNCKEYLNKLKNYKDNLKSFEELEAPIGFEKKIMRKIDEKEKRFGIPLSQRLILEISAALILFGSLFVVYISIGKQKEKATPSVISEEKIKTAEEKIEISQKKECDKIEDFEFKKQKDMEKEAKKSVKIPLEKKKISVLLDMPIESNKKKSEEKVKKELKQEELLSEAVPEGPAPILNEEKKAAEPLELAKSVVIPIYRITIKISEENFKESINKIEEILKNEKIDFKKIKVNEYREEIFMPSKDFKNIMEKISNIEGVKIENYNPDETINNKEIKIDLLKD